MQVLQVVSLSIILWKVHNIFTIICNIIFIIQEKIVFVSDTIGPVILDSQSKINQISNDYDSNSSNISNFNDSDKDQTFTVQQKNHSEQKLGNASHYDYLTINTFNKL